MGIVDFHTHVLPGIDDGSQSIAESMALLRAAARQGITHMVATPHFYPQYDTPERFLDRRNRAEQQLREVMASEKKLPKLHIGAEVFYFHGISKSEEISKLTIDNSPYMLIEMPPAPWSEAMYQELADLYEKRGYFPIIAHVDRYISRFRTFGIPDRLMELPVLVQANAEFFLERSTASMAMRMLQKGKIQLLGSDCHNLKNRKPNMGEALEKIRCKLGKAVVEEISACSEHILSNF